MSEDKNVLDNEDIRSAVKKGTKGISITIKRILSSGHVVLNEENTFEAI